MTLHSNISGLCPIGRGRMLIVDRRKGWETIEMGLNWALQKNLDRYILQIDDWCWTGGGSLATFDLVACRNISI